MADDPRREGCALRPAPLLLLAVFVCACAQQPPSVLTSEPNIPPANARADILAYLRTYLNDPTGVRDAYISDPQLQTVGATIASDNAPATPATQRYMVCLRFNAKDSTGKYQGSRDHLVAFLSGRLDTLVPARREQCAKANWQPFPELEKLRR